MTASLTEQGKLYCESARLKSGARGVAMTTMSTGPPPRVRAAACGGGPTSVFIRHRYGMLQHSVPKCGSDNGIDLIKLVMYTRLVWEKIVSRGP